MTEILPAVQPDANFSAERLGVEHLHLAITQTRKRHVLSPIAAALLGIGLWPVTEHWRLVSLTLVLLLISVWRAIFIRAYDQAGPAQRHKPVWESRFLLSLFVVSAVWGLGAVWVMPAGSPAHQLLVYCFVIGMVGGSTATHSIHLPSARISLPTIILPSTAWFLARGDSLHWVAAAAGIILLLASLRGSQLMNASMRKTIELTAMLEDAALTDSLSGLRNRRAFDESGMQLLAGQTGGAALLILDIDHFKAINDRYGHTAGDEVIRALGSLLKSSVENAASCARIGGDEFAILLVDDDGDEVSALATRLLQAVRDLHIPVDDEALQTTASIGYATTGPESQDFEALFWQADMALYEAKRSGRDRAVAYLEAPARSAV